jgi:hypothetical protein
MAGVVPGIGRSMGLGKERRRRMVLRTGSMGLRGPLQAWALYARIRLRRLADAEIAVYAWDCLQRPNPYSLKHNIFYFLTCHRLPKQRFGASTGAAEKTHRAWVTASRAQQNIRQTRADTRHPRRHIRGAYLSQICISADSLVTMHRAVGLGLRCIFDHADANDR